MPLEMNRVGRIEGPQLPVEKQMIVGPCSHQARIGQSSILLPPTIFDILPGLTQGHLAILPYEHLLSNSET